MTIGELHDIFLRSSGVATDSRTVSGGEVFFALRGENFDGNDYAVRALIAGAGCAVVAEDRAEAIFEELYEKEEGKIGSLKDAIIPVKDVLGTLQELARYHRSVTLVNGKPLTVIGLTGTNGKTTTKELIRAVLSTKYRVSATEGNLNNSIGVPLTLLKINSLTEIAVVEMGASHPGDIKELCSVALPNYGLITNVGKAHLLGFGSFEGVMQAKGELYDYIQRTADKAFLNVDNQWLRKMAADRPDMNVIPYGLSYSGASVLPSSAREPFLRLSVAGRVISTHLIGAYNADNVLAAIAVGAEFGVGLEAAAEAIESYIPQNNRSQLTDTGRNLLIVDAYNANPTSMEAALDNFERVEAERKVVMLGNMLELGEDSVAEHVRVVEKLRGMRLEGVYLVGEEFRKALEEAGATGGAEADGKMAGGAAGGAADRAEGRIGVQPEWYKDSDGLASAISEKAFSGVTVLIKGSRGSRMERVLAVL